MAQKYDRKKIELLVPISQNVSDLLRKMGTTTHHASSVTHMGKRLRAWGIDTSHFDTRKFKKGCKSNKRRGAEERLVLHSEESRKTDAYILRRCLEDIERPYICEACGQTPIWNKKPLVLQVDHINGNNRDDRPENLRFLCPNCHTQTLTYGAKNIAKGKMAECIIASVSNTDIPQGVSWVGIPIFPPQI